MQTYIRTYVICIQGVKSEGMLLVGDQQKPEKKQGLLKAGDGTVAPGTQVCTQTHVCVYVCV